ncbi:hypothetical protein Hanom_Chr16g01455431 [Helianthus anomalus]
MDWDLHRPFNFQLPAHTQFPIHPCLLFIFHLQRIERTREERMLERGRKKEVHM